MTDQLEKNPSITEVFIRPGCTICGLCEDTCPEVFDVQAETSVIRPAAGRFYQTHSLRIIQAIGECPVDVIRARGVNEPV